MDVALFKQTCEAHHAGVVNALKSGVSDAKLRTVDHCVLTYLLRMLEGQTSAESFLTETTIEETLSSYFFEFDCVESEAAAQIAAKKVCTAMEAAGLNQRPKADTVRLDTPMSLGKQYEATMRKATTYGGQKIVVNTNDEWTWDTKKDAAKSERKKKKDDEKQRLLQNEYDEYLKKRGLALNQKVVKVHHKGESTYQTDIIVNHITIRMGKQLLYDDADLIMHSGHKYGLVGRNGGGKTTILRALSERELPGINPFIQILHVEQEITGGTASPVDMLLEADVERANLIREEQELLKSEDTSGRLAEVYERLELIDAHSAEARASAILHGLSFTKEMMNNPTKLLSGGWRMRVALARALFVEPDVLLLDEPTNHLDLHAVMWLEQFLSKWEKTLVVVSHSKSFLNAVCTEVIHLDQCKLNYYKGDYDTFEATRLEQLKQQGRTFESQERQIQHMQAFVDRFKYNANRAKMAQSRMKAIERIERVAPVMIEHATTFDFPEPDEAQAPYLQVIDAEFGFAQSLFHDVNFGLDGESRIALVGPNGAGKSTFIKMCLGLIEPRKGQVIRNPKVRIGHFAQHHLDLLNAQQTSVEFMRTKFPDKEEGLIRAHLGSFGLSGDKALQPIYTLSGGQKSRLALAWITYTRPHLLLLDEPTNHLDIDTVDALLRALLEWGGGLMVVSHDEHFITSLCEEIYVCGKGNFGKFDGDFDAYKKTVAAKLKSM
jgi:ATP-binding cassette subfamily F protein 3